MIRLADRQSLQSHMDWHINKLMFQNGKRNHIHHLRRVIGQIHKHLNVEFDLKVTASEIILSLQHVFL